MKILRMAVVLVLLVAATTLVASAQTTVFVPGNASGYFGNTADKIVPPVSAIEVSGPATITVTYVSGTVNFGTGVQVGPNGGTFVAADYQLPLQEATGIAPRLAARNIAALMGVFVPQTRVQIGGFSAIDGTKNAVRTGIMPDGLFFVGESKTITVKEAGTLFLGVNDSGVSDNSGGFTVQVTTSLAK